MITDYVRTLGDALRFDPAMARGVVQEVEDHFGEALDADRAGDRRDAERRAVARFGDPHALAAEFAMLSLARRLRRAAVAVLLALASVLVIMKARVAWYAAVQWALREDVRELSAIVLSIDRAAFWVAAVSGSAAVLYLVCSPVRTASRSDHRRFCRALLLCACATTALAVSVIGDGVLIALRIGTELSADVAVPLLLMAVEIACAAAVIALVLGAMRRAAHTEALLKCDVRSCDACLTCRQ